MKDFIYYRCGGSDGYRFGGERICINSQVQGGFLETAVWREVSNLLMNPEKIELEREERSKAGGLLDNLGTLRSQRTKLDHAMEKLIDSFTEGLIEKDQFTSRMDRTKRRIADLDAKIRENAGDVDQQENLRLATNRLRELATAVGPELADANWRRRREITRTLVQRVEIAPDVISIVFRVTQDSRRSPAAPIVVSLARPRRQESRKCAS